MSDSSLHGCWLVTQFALSKRDPTVTREKNVMSPHLVHFLTGWWQLKYGFGIFIPAKFGEKKFPILTSTFFQRGWSWNHQLDFHFPVFRQGPVNSHFSWPQCCCFFKVVDHFVCQARRRFRSWSHWVGFGRGHASRSEKSEFVEHDRFPIELTSYAGSMVWFLQRLVSYFWRTLQWCQLRWMTKLRFAFKTLPFFAAFFLGLFKSRGWHQHRDSGLTCWDFWVGCSTARGRRRPAGKAR